MKIINFAIVFALIMFPFMIINNLHMSSQRLTMNQQLRYNAALKAAVQDAAYSLTANADPAQEAGYGSTKKYSANKDAAVATFFHTLYLNFGIQDDPIAQGVVQRYIPAIVVIDYDGYYIYTPQAYNDAQGQTELKHVWSAKKPFAYVDDQHNSLAFTLDDHVVAYDASSGTWQEGRRGDISSSVNIPLLNDPNAFDQVRRETIVNAIQNVLAYTINSYNSFTSKIGVAYTFTLPTIDQEEWNNTINDIGILAFMQGVPIGDTYYNNYALGGSRIVKKAAIYGVKAPDGTKYYYRSTCSSYSYPVQETFTTEKEAAENGYKPLSCNAGQQ